MSSSQIGSRRDLFDYFQYSIEGTYSGLVDDRELGYGQNMLKSFLIESNIHPERLSEFANVDSYDEIDTSLVRIDIRPPRSGADAEESLDEEASQLDDFVTTEEVQNKKTDIKEPLTFYLDYQDPRFWTLFTLESSKEAKDIISGFMSGVSNGLDYTWFPISLTRDISKMGEVRGLGIQYKADEVFSEEYIDEKLEFGDLSVQSSGHGASKLFDILSEQEQLRSFISLKSVKIRREIEESFVIERVTRRGQFTTRGGDSVQIHLDLLDEVRTQYSTLIEKIEENHRLSYTQQEHGVSVDGSPLIINLNNEIEDIPAFIDSVVSSKNPMRLWGAKTQLDDDYYKVKGVDLHNNDKYTMEIAPSWIRLYLSEDACGNTALRIYSNLQKYYDSEAEMLIQ